MRLLIRLQCVESSSYEMQYHYHIQGFIYRLLLGSKYHFLHDKEGYKFFNFSNIFPVTPNLEKNDLRTFLVSSPESEFITYLYDQLLKYHNVSTLLEIGIMKFRIISIDKLIIKLPIMSHFTLITGTPIIVRIPREKYQMYGIKPYKNYSYIFWKHEHPIILFLEQLESNLVKKLSEFLKISGEPEACHKYVTLKLYPSFFQKFKFKKQISTKISMPNKGIEQVVIGTLWEFGFNRDSDKQLIQFVLDCGLGERNSLGFGFMNLAST
jgi:CRISPR-associated endoribonuclease Cas6